MISTQVPCGSARASAWPSVVGGSSSNCLLRACACDRAFPGVWTGWTQLLVCTSFLRQAVRSAPGERRETSECVLSPPQSWAPTQPSGFRGTGHSLSALRVPQGPGASCLLPPRSKCQLVTTVITALGTLSAKHLLTVIYYKCSTELGSEFIISQVAGKQSCKQTFPGNCQTDETR